MNDPYRLQLERFERQLAALASHLTHRQLIRFGPPSWWQPSFNVYRCSETFIVCVDLAGVDREAISVRVERRRLFVRGTRQPPEPGCDQPTPVKVLAMEIDYGPFERVLELPADVDATRVTADYRDGLLWVHLPLLKP